MEALIRVARERKVRVIVCSILPVSGEVLKLVTNGAIVATNALLKAAAGRQDAIYVDLHSALVDDQGRFDARYTVEGFHANALGYFEMSRLLHPVLVKAYADTGS
jgi:lysophospholipase L1-like esterase